MLETKEGVVCSQGCLKYPLTRCTKFYPEGIRIVYPTSRCCGENKLHPRVLRISGHRADFEQDGRQYSRAQTAPSDNRPPCFRWIFLSFPLTRFSHPFQDKLQRCLKKKKNEEERILLSQFYFGIFFFFF